jgi:hypothetical protein
LGVATVQEIEQRFTRGVELLSQLSPDLGQGLNLLMIAANAGHAEAERLLAVYTAAGFGLPQSWTACSAPPNAARPKRGTNLFSSPARRATRRAIGDICVRVSI